jgi:hypothetical protein
MLTSPRSPKYFAYSAWLAISDKTIVPCRTEPEPIQSIVNAEFAAATDPFLDMLQQVLPEQSRSQLSWKLDLAIATLIRVLTEAGKPYGLLKSNSPEDIQATTQQLVRFLSPGMRSQL